MVDAALLRDQTSMRRSGHPAGAVGLVDGNRDPLRFRRLRVGKSAREEVVHVVIDFLLGGQVLEVRLEHGHERLLAGGREFRDRDGHDDPDDHYDDQQLDQREALLAVSVHRPIPRV